MVAEKKNRPSASSSSIGLLSTSCRPHTYRPPTRTIHNPLMRSNFLTALANPAVPLSGSKLGNVNVPHGIKGEGMLEIGWERGVAVARMGWLIGVVGGLEVVSAST